MSEFAFRTIESTDGFVVAIRGAIDENTQFKSIDLKNHKTVIFDLEEVVSVNSTGIRSWLAWFKNWAHDKILVFRKCPRTIVTQMNVIRGFIPPSARVESFYVPYRCERCDSAKDVLFTVDSKKSKPPLTIPCTGCPEQMELAVPPKHYLHFLDF